MFINEMNTGDQVEGCYLLQSAYSKQSSNGKPFLSIVLGDCTGTMDGKVWDYPGPIGASDMNTPLVNRHFDRANPTP
jgi:3'-5' exoribonuclease